MLVAAATTEPVFRTEFVKLNFPPIEAVPGGFVSELTTRFGTCCTVMVPAALRQLFVSTSSDTPFGPSAHACTKYVPGRVSENSESAATGLALAPGASAGTA